MGSRTWPEFVHTLYTAGLYHTVCTPSFLEENPVTALWTWLFVLSKLPELGDTVFIVLRKQKLIFLHWYHHVTVLVYCWYSFLKAIRLGVPRCVAMLITSLQLLQMVVGCF